MVEIQVLARVMEAEYGTRAEAAAHVYAVLTEEDTEWRPWAQALDEDVSSISLSLDIELAKAKEVFVDLLTDFMAMGLAAENEVSWSVCVGEDSNGYQHYYKTAAALAAQQLAWHKAHLVSHTHRDSMVTIPG